MDALAAEIRAGIYAHFRDTGRAPTVAECALAAGCSIEAAAQALGGLAADHALALRPDRPDIWMAHPFSAVPTDYRVEISGRSWWANCAWDGLGVLALLGDGVVHTHSPLTGEPVAYEVESGEVRPDGIVHFVVPARRFWDDIGYT